MDLVSDPGTNGPPHERMDSHMNTMRAIHPGDFATLDRAPIFILCTARTGSTLLQRLLGSHPAIAAPTELNLVDAFCVIQQLYGLLDGDRKENEARADEACRTLAADTIGRYGESRLKSRWSEKSLVTAAHAGLVARIYPEAQFICLYRECLDMIASGLEASPFGFAGYGFQPYAADTPANHVLAMARYWIDTTTSIVDAEAMLEGRSLRVRYEDLVFDTDLTFKRLQSFLGLLDEVDPSRALASNGDRLGLGDHKIEYTEEITPQSVGKGWRIPVDMIPEQLRERINELEDKLGYPRLEADLQRSLVTLAARRRPSQWMEIAEELLTRRLHPCNAQQPLSDSDEHISVIVPDLDVQWAIGLKSGTFCRVVGQRDPSLIMDFVTLAGLLNQTLNPAVAIRQRTLQLVSQTRTPDEMRRLLHRFIALVGARP